MVRRWVLATVASLLLGIQPLAQEAPAGPAKLDVQPAELTLEVGAKATLTARAMDEDGNPVQAPVVFYSRSRRSVGVTADGTVEAYRPGNFTLVALVPKDPEDEPRRAEALLQVEIPVTVPNPPVASIEFVNVPKRFYADTVLPLDVNVLDTTGTSRPDVKVTYAVDDPSVARVDGFGGLTLLQPGTTRVGATAERANASLTVKVEPNPIDAMELTSSAEKARTGDVVRFAAVAKDARGQTVPDVPIRYAIDSRPDEKIVASGSTAQVAADGRFVAERPGLYTVVAVAGRQSAAKTIEITRRDVERHIEIVGHGRVRGRRTSDLWIWTAPNGRDYAITGTHSADGHAYIWDVTDPTNIVEVAVVRVDARTVNDVKLSEDGRIAVISREGASNRRNGIVILDVSDPANGVQILSRYDDQLTGGVHNVFVYQNHVYAVNNGRRFDVINIEDPRQPMRVGRFELDTPGHGIHDVWVVDGIAYSSNWTDGIVAIDVGGGGKGGSPKNPVKLGSHTWPSGWNHAAFPYRSKSTGKFYVFGGDEAFPYRDLDLLGGTPNRAAGWIHVIEWDEWDRPREVARYEVPEAGTHNLWIEDDIMYIGYYNGGLRVVDVSGELMGDLYKQGREMAFFMPYDPEGVVPNAPFTWGAQPFKGNVFIADYNSGLWALKVTEKKGEGINRGEPR